MDPGPELGPGGSGQLASKIQDTRMQTGVGGQAAKDRIVLLQLHKGSFVLLDFM